MNFAKFDLINILCDPRSNANVSASFTLNTLLLVGLGVAGARKIYCLTNEMICIKPYSTNYPLQI